MYEITALEWKRKNSNCQQAETALKKMTLYAPGGACGSWFLYHKDCFGFDVTNVFKTERAAKAFATKRHEAAVKKWLKKCGSKRTTGG